MNPGMNVILIEGVVKGYHECPFIVRTGESFVVEKKIGHRGKAFRVVSTKGKKTFCNSVTLYSKHSNKY